MMANKSPPTHTAGPWKSSDICVRHPAFDRPYAVIETQDGRHRIASVQSDLPDEVCLANARLIASAPALLKALEDAATAMECEDSPWMDDKAAKARAAIDRARGQ
jgi:hypothetical protein